LFAIHGWIQGIFTFYSTSCTLPIRVATKKNQYTDYNDDIIYVNYQGSRYLEGDIIDLWGRVDGLETYSAPWYNTVSFPKITAYHTEFVMKPSSYSNTSTTISLKPVY